MADNQLAQRRLHNFLQRFLQRHETTLITAELQLLETVESKPLITPNLTTLLPNADIANLMFFPNKCFIFNLEYQVMNKRNLIVDGYLRHNIPYNLYWPDMRSIITKYLSFNIHLGGLTTSKYNQIKTQLVNEFDQENFEKQRNHEQQLNRSITQFFNLTDEWQQRPRFNPLDLIVGEEILYIDVMDDIDNDVEINVHKCDIVYKHESLNHYFLSGRNNHKIDANNNNDILKLFKINDSDSHILATNLCDTGEIIRENRQSIVDIYEERSKITPNCNKLSRWCILKYLNTKKIKSIKEIMDEYNDSITIKINNNLCLKSNSNENRLLKAKIGFGIFGMKRCKVNGNYMSLLEILIKYQNSDNFKQLCNFYNNNKYRNNSTSSMRIDDDVKDDVDHDNDDMYMWNDLKTFLQNSIDDKGFIYDKNNFCYYIWHDLRGPCVQVAETNSNDENWELFKFSHLNMNINIKNNNTYNYPWGSNIMIPENLEILFEIKNNKESILTSTINGDKDKKDNIQFSVMTNQVVSTDRYPQWDSIRRIRKYKCDIDFGMINLNDNDDMDYVIFLNNPVCNCEHGGIVFDFIFE